MFYSIICPRFRQQARIRLALFWRIYTFSIKNKTFKIISETPKGRFRNVPALTAITIYDGFPQWKFNPTVEFTCIEQRVCVYFIFWLFFLCAHTSVGFSRVFRICSFFSNFCFVCSTTTSFANEAFVHCTYVTSPLRRCRTGNTCWKVKRLNSFGRWHGHKNTHAKKTMEWRTIINCCRVCGVTVVYAKL